MITAISSRSCISRLPARGCGRQAEEEIRRSGFDYTILRAGVLTNTPGGQRAIEVGQGECALTFRSRIPREDVAEAFVRALAHPKTRRTTFNVVGAPGSRRHEWNVLFDRLHPDP